LSGRKQRFRKLTLYLNDLLPERFWRCQTKLIDAKRIKTF
jgi:hypothetical protein